MLFPTMHFHNWVVIYISTTIQEIVSHIDFWELTGKANYDLNLDSMKKYILEFKQWSNKVL